MERLFYARPGYSERFCHRDCCQGMPKDRSFLLLGVPAFIVLAGVAYMSQLYPIALNGGGFFGQDPAYQYLFASVDILQGHAPGHTDHPGTPLQSMIAFLILVVWGIRRVTGLTDLGMFESVLSTPETYLASASVTLLLLGTVAAYFLGRRVLQTTGSLIAAVSCQLTPLMFVLVTPYIVYPTPEAALLCISVALMAALAPVLLGTDPLRATVTPRVAILAGVLCGIGVAVKITFVPLVGLLLSLWSLRLLWRACLAMVLAWLVGVLPIWSRLPAMFAWFNKVLTHSELHGLGDQAVFNAQQFMQSIVSVMNMFPLLYDVALVVLVVLCLGLVRKMLGVLAKPAGRSSTFGVPAGAVLNVREFVPPVTLLLVLAGQTIMVAKHPGPTYMIAVLPVAVMGAAWLLVSQRMVSLPTLIRPWLAGAWLLFLGYVSLNASLTGYGVVRAIHQTGEKSRDAILAETSRYANPVLIGTFNCNLPECALWFGMLMVPEMELKMDRITPDFYHFDIFGKKLHVPGVGELSAEATADTVNRLVQSGRPVFLVSPPFEQLAQFRLEKISGDSVQNLYRVVGVERPN